MAGQAIQIGELARRTGCNIETIRYYEQIGLISAPLRRGRYRTYETRDVEQLSFVRRARELGFKLDEVRALLTLATDEAAACAEVRDLAAAHLHDVRARIADLRRMERVLADAVKACEAGQDPGCPLIQTLGAKAGGAGQDTISAAPWARP
ncbi:helix-turn-helix domain-containing protein [uncultured Caulobacter sp.]|uniref:MerR family transcriptional regulator n=1 Tax=uncultured Caulobacter sp. TaxID=158749 RepID=UPI0026128656|nr:helix-turn-helix domain-containing protein [uncultured Caulobacter sp.]